MESRRCLFFSVRYMLSLLDVCIRRKDGGILHWYLYDNLWQGFWAWRSAMYSFCSELAPIFYIYVLFLKIYNTINLCQVRTRLGNNRLGFILYRDMTHTQKNNHTLNRGFLNTSQQISTRNKWTKTRPNMFKPGKTQHKHVHHNRAFNLQCNLWAPSTPSSTLQYSNDSILQWS